MAKSAAAAASTKRKTRRKRVRRKKNNSPVRPNKVRRAAAAKAIMKTRSMRNAVVRASHGKDDATCSSNSNSSSCSSSSSTESDESGVGSMHGDADLSQDSGWRTHNKDDIADNRQTRAARHANGEFSKEYLLEDESQDDAAGLQEWTKPDATDKSEEATSESLQASEVCGPEDGQLSFAESEGGVAAQLEPNAELDAIWQCISGSDPDMICKIFEDRYLRQCRAFGDEPTVTARGDEGGNGRRRAVIAIAAQQELWILYPMDERCVGTCWFCRKPRTLSYDVHIGSTSSIVAQVGSVCATRFHVLAGAYNVLGRIMAHQANMEASAITQEAVRAVWREPVRQLHKHLVYMHSMVEQYDGRRVP